VQRLIGGSCAATPDRRVELRAGNQEVDCCDDCLSLFCEIRDDGSDLRAADTSELRRQQDVRVAIDLNKRCQSVDGLLRELGSLCERDDDS
jgi:hypothetical protein